MPGSNGSGRRTPRVGLVLGGGGVAGLAFHAGTLAALHHDTGWDPSIADIVIGTSAGSIAGAMLRAGISTEDLAAWGSNVGPSTNGHAHRPMLEHFANGRPRVHIRPAWRPQYAHLYRTLVGSRNFSAAAMSMLPHGFLDLSTAVGRVDVFLPEWPDRALWVTAVRLADGRRTVFDGTVSDGEQPVKPHEAVAASCAIPFLTRPVEVDGRNYIDGGVHSPTNADLLCGADVDVAVVLAPMAGKLPPKRVSGPHDMIRRSANRRLAQECQVLRDAGVEVHTLVPDARTLVAMGVNSLDRRRAPAVLREAFLATGAQLTPALRASLGGRASVVA